MKSYMRDMKGEFIKWLILYIERDKYVQNLQRMIVYFIFEVDFIMILVFCYVLIRFK